MAFDARNFVIDHVVRGVMYHSSTGEILWSINQITNPSLNISTETQDAVDAIGNRILSFDRSKNAEFTAENSLFDLGLLAAQSGTTKKLATSLAKIVIPKFFEAEIPSSGTSITLPKAPVGVGAAGIPFIYKMNGDSSLSTKYAYAASAGANAFTFTGSSLTFPTGLTAGDRLFIPYEYEADGEDNNGAAAVDATATSYPAAGKFVMEVLGSDPCDVSTKYFAYLVFPNAKLLGNLDMTFTTEGTHAFTIQANQAYCDNVKRLFSLLLPEA